MAFRGAISVGKQANTSLFSIPYYLRTIYNVSPANPFTRLNPISHNQTGLKYSIRAVSGTSVDPVVSKKQKGEESSQNWKIKMLYDGECPLCMREVNMLRERNKSYGTIKFVDISSEEYTPEENEGLDYKTPVSVQAKEESHGRSTISVKLSQTLEHGSYSVMGKIHAIESDRTVVTDIEAFRKLYEAVDLGWVYAITKYEPIATIADAVYGFWAKYRLQVTGRPPLEEVLEARRKKGEICDDSKACKM